MNRTMETEKENSETAKQVGDFNQNKSNDHAYLFEQYLMGRSSLPIPCASRKFYSKQNINATKNSTRTARRAELPSLQGPNKEMIALQRSKVDGTLLENIETIENEMKICKDETKLNSQRGGCKLHNAQHTLTISSTRGSRVIGSSFFKI